MDIKVDHVSKAYGEQQILRDLCCVFPEGKTTCISNVINLKAEDIYS